MAYSYGCVMVRLPELLAEEIRSYGASIPSQYLKTGNEDAPSGLPKEIHTTVKYGLMEEDPVRVAEVIAGTEPIVVTLGRASIFHNENQAVLKLGIESPGLRALHNKLCSNLRHVNTYRDFRAHVTVAYLVKRDDDPYYYRQFFDDSFAGRQFEVRQLEFSSASGLKCQISLYGGCEMRQESAELLMIAKSLMARKTKAVFVDNPGIFNRDKEDEMEKVRSEAEEKLKRELEEVKGRYYWYPGHRTMINITLSGKPLFHNYTIGGMHGLGYRNGVLTVNPQWVSGKEDAMASYKWGYVVDNMIQTVKQSDRIDRTIEATLDKAEQKIGKKIDADVRREIVQWCMKIAKGRLSASAWPGPKGREFTIFQPEVVGTPTVARDRMSDMDPMAMERIGSMYMEIAKWTTKTAMGRPSTAPIVVQLLESQNKVAERIKGKGGLTGRAAVEAMIHAMSGLYTIDAPPLRRLWRKYGDDVEQMLRDANIL